MAVLKWIGVGLLAVVALAAAGIGVTLAMINTDWGRRLAGREATAMLGRTVVIDGPLRVHLGNPIHIHVEGLHIANTGWAKEKTFADVRVLDATLLPWPLLRGDLDLPEVTVSGPKLDLEKNERGDNNWTFAPGAGKSAAKQAVKPDNRGEVPVIGSLRVEDGRIRYRDPNADVDLNSKLNTATGGNGEDRVRLDGQGTFAGKPFKLAMEGGSLQYLRDNPKPYPLKIDAAVGKTTAKVEGTIAEPVKMQGVDLSLALAGDDLAEIFPIIGIPVPKTRPYSLSGHLTEEGTTWRMQGVKGKVGDSDLSGDVAADLGGERPRITADLTSNRLAAVDLAGFVGASPEGAGSYPTKGPGRVLPATEVDLKRLRFADMDVTFKGKRVEAPGAPLDDLSTHLTLENGRATLDPLKLGIGNGRVAGTTVLDGREKTAALDVNLEVRGVKLAPFFRETSFAREMSGTMTGRVQLAGQGPTVADILAAANGKLGLAIEGGRISTLAVKGLRTNILETLGVVLSGDKPMPFNCFVTDLQARNGIVSVDALVLDAPETLITGDGGLNLKRETISMRVLGRSKSPQIFATHVPVTIGGTFGDPDIGVDATESAARGAAAVALGVLLTPLASILPLVDTGSDERASCGALIRDAKAPAGKETGAGASGVRNRGNGNGSGR